MLTTSGSFCSTGATASVLGRLIGIALVSSGAVTMNTTSSTSITSTSGVTLISLSTSSVSCVEKAISGRLLHFLHIALGCRLVRRRVDQHAERTLLRQAVEVVGEVIQVRRRQFQTTQKIVVIQHRRHRDGDPHAGGDQCRANRSGDRFKARRTRRADAFQRFHDSPYRAEQTNERRGA